MPSTHNRLGYLPALDGVRALAVVAVLAYNLGLDWAPGGFAGVEVFFVLSGWLICALLLAEQRSEGRIDLRAFWLRRARRLLPAATLVAITTLVVAALANYDRLISLRLDAATTLAYVFNWRLVLEGQSYVAGGEPSPLQHLWSLSIEEQFYILLPLVLGTTFVVLRPPERVAPIVVGVAGTLTLWRLFLLAGDDLTHAYYGTDTRAVGLLAGVALAFVWTPPRLRPSPGAVPALTATGVAALGVLAWYVTSMDGRDAGAFGWPLTTVQIAAVVLIAVLVHPSGTTLAAALSVPPLRWLGVRSYSFYLWHWPIVVAFAKDPGQRAESPVRTVFMLGLIILCATLSYRFVEQPIRRRGVRGAIRRVRAHVVVNLAGRPLAAGTVTALAVVALVGGLLLTVDAAFAPASNGADVDVVETAGSASNRTMSAPTSTTSLPRPGAAQRVSPTSAPPPPAASALPPITEPDPGPPRTRTTTAIGDSIILGAAPSLGVAVPAISIDGEISRQGADAASHVRRLEAAGQLGDVVVLHLGANGPYSGAVVDEVVDVVGKRRLVLVNTKVPRRWEDEVNATLADAAARHRNVRLVDWHTVASTEPGLLASDGYHLSPAGAQRYAALIAEAVASA